MTATRSDAKTVCRRATELMADGSLGWISPSQLFLPWTALAKCHGGERAEAR